MSLSENFRIRPAGRHILTIGRELIHDSYAAVIELVKNAYDADSPDVDVVFRANSGHDGYTIVISDHGHGMTRDTVINKWMVPSTDDKVDRKASPQGRIMQGSKGIGRYAAAVLGNDLLLETTTSEGEKTLAYVEWDAFSEAKFLDEVEIPIETAKSISPSGTQLTISGNDEFFSNWDKKQFDDLRYELKKLIPPIEQVLSRETFNVTLSIKGFSDEMDLKESVEPFPIFEFYDYRISGRVNADGTGILEYTVQKKGNAAKESIHLVSDAPTGCGDLVLDIRVYDRESDAIDSLIGRGLKDESGRFVGKNQAKRLLNYYNGIGVYRNGFRIRPLGDTDFDWLKLNYRRVQDPSIRIGSNQVIGYVLIQSEDQSGLIEKSARDGLKENLAYENLKQVTRRVIAELERRRFVFRREAGLGQPTLKVERELERLFSYDEMKREIRTRLHRGVGDHSAIDEIFEIIDRDEEEKNKAAERIRQAVAIYQGQATLGKIINVVLHEGRQPLNYFRNQIPNLRYWYNAVRKSNDPSKLEKLLPIAEGLGENANRFVQLFRRLDPLAAGRRSAKSPLKLKDAIRGVLSIFQSEMDSLNVSAEIKGPDDLTFPSWRQDIYAIFANLIDNSLYWMSKERTRSRKIIIELLTVGESLRYIDYRDTGPGIEPTYIADEVIFEPHFSTKPDGTGLGLAIAGEAADRNGLELKVYQSEEGAYFRLQPKKENEE